MAEFLLVVVLVLLAILISLMILYYFGYFLSRLGSLTKLLSGSGDIRIPVLDLPLKGLKEEDFSPFVSLSVSSDREVDCVRYFFEVGALVSLTYCSYSGLVYRCQVVLKLPEGLNTADLYSWFRERVLRDEKARFYARENPDSKSIEVFGWRASYYLRGSELVMDFQNEALKKELKHRKIDDMFKALDERVKGPSSEVLRKSYES